MGGDGGIGCCGLVWRVGVRIYCSPWNTLKVSSYLSNIFCGMHR